MSKVLSGKRSDPSNIRIAAGVILIIAIAAFTFLRGGNIGISGFLVFQQNTQPDFDAGTYNNTAYNSTGSYVQLSGGNSAGTYVSKVFDAGTAIVWNNINWGEGLAYQEEFSSDANTLGLYNFNDDTSDNAFTDSSSGHTAYIIGGASQTANGKFSSAATFNGENNSYLNISDRTAFDINEGTLELWFKPAATYGPDLPEEKFLYIRKVNSNNNLRISFNANTSQLKFRIRSGGGGGYNALSAQSTWNAGVWYFAAASWGPNGMKLYVNGVQDGSNSFTGAPSWADTEVLHIGADSDGTKSFNGTIDELRISNVQKSATEILNDYKRGILNLRFQAHTSSDNSSWGDFTGDYTTPLSNLSIENNRYFQYIAHFSTENANYSSELYNVSINYEDTIEPSITFASPTPENINLQQNWAYVNITLSEDANSTALEWNGVNESLLGNGANWYANKTELANGNYTFKVFATDNSNNTGVSGQKWVNINVAPPAPPPAEEPSATSGGGGGSSAIAAPTPAITQPPAVTTPPEIPPAPAPAETAPAVQPAAAPQANATTAPSALAVLASTISANYAKIIIGAFVAIIGAYFAFKYRTKFRLRARQSRTAH